MKAEMLEASSICLSTTAGRETAAGFGSNEFPLDQWLGRRYEYTAPVLGDSTVTVCALFAGSILEIKCVTGVV